MSVHRGRLRLAWTTLFWSNLFVVSSRIAGVPRTVRLIQRLACALPADRGSLEAVSECFDRLRRRIGFAFLARRQKCLLRGMLLYFYGKRLGIEVRLVFGVKPEDGKSRWHCWLVQGKEVVFEVDDVVREFATMVEYT